ncbi:Sec-independent protein translocase subunit TatA [Compostimonas suwonensis]|uniref:Sec-independent protein translocase protein TatA n=1 Tax=Compostimonas suwonensis TaxID=1048394 RepID=A0A2M9BYT7_9MICO|nr:Sec-independent protein translocase subunit TatA [Compostimonas suwonensis]PJJ63251.1 sec-independent protein translocase protein TatA [Compostimonas suwonensis]
MLNNLTGWHFLIILAVVLLLFGAPKLPALARSLGQSMRIFRGEVKTMKDENKPAEGEGTAANTSDSAATTPVQGDSSQQPKP